MSKYNRLTDNDRHFLCFDLGQRHPDWRPLGVVLDSGDDEHPGCSLLLRAFGWTLRVRLPRVIKPYGIKHIAKSWDAATIERLGRNWYVEVFPREYGFSLNDGFLQVFLGPQTHDSETTKGWCKHLPWTQWRFVRHSWYGFNGEHLRTDPEMATPEERRAQWDSRHAFEKIMPKVVFEIEDYDGARIRAATHIEEREWRFGTGWFKWLSLFRKPKVSRSLDIEFSNEVGPEKGSWKGGTMGTSINMLPGELHEDAFRRYCQEEHRSKYRRFRVTFIGRCDG